MKRWLRKILYRPFRATALWLGWNEKTFQQVELTYTKREVPLQKFTACHLHTEDVPRKYVEDIVRRNIAAGLPVEFYTRVKEDWPVSRGQKILETRAELTLAIMPRQRDLEDL